MRIFPTLSLICLFCVEITSGCKPEYTLKHRQRMITKKGRQGREMSDKDTSCKLRAPWRFSQAIMVSLELEAEQGRRTKREGEPLDRCSLPLPDLPEPQPAGNIQFDLDPVDFMVAIPAEVGRLSWTVAEFFRAFVERVNANFRDKNIVFFTIERKQTICGCQRTTMNAGCLSLRALRKEDGFR